MPAGSQPDGGIPQVGGDVGVSGYVPVVGVVGGGDGGCGEGGEGAGWAAGDWEGVAGGEGCYSEVGAI